MNTTANTPNADRAGSTGPRLRIPSPDWTSRSTAGTPNEAADADRIRRALTEREKQILRLVCDGLSNAEIAARLGISPETVKSELKRIFRKIEVKNRTQAAVLLVREGLL